MRLRWTAPLLFVLSIVPSGAVAAEEPRITVMLPGGLGYLMGAIVGRSWIAITPGRELAHRGVPTLRQPEWTGPDPARPPPIYARVLRVTF